ncbi:hypothetical protein GCM10023200_05520 [Actinomycetospora chlora]|uniref:Uncharacterized protein n=1 Tax=Actinomycetospora chlora TaxID=663608 RepID=A0ABP9A9E1_9PSEU
MTPPDVRDGDGPPPDAWRAQAGPATAVPGPRVSAEDADADAVHGGVAARDVPHHAAPWETHLRDSLAAALHGDPARHGHRPDVVDVIAHLIVRVARADHGELDRFPGLQDAARHLLHVVGLDPGASPGAPTAPVATPGTPPGGTGPDPDAGPGPIDTSPADTPPADTHPVDTPPATGAGNTDVGSADTDTDPDPDAGPVIPVPRAEVPATGPAGTYHGGVVVQQVLPGGEGRLRVTYADGSQRDVTRTVVDGTTTDTYSRADGVVVTETYGADGGWTATGPDGATTTAVRAGDVLTEEVRAADGTVTTTTARLAHPSYGITIRPGEQQFTTTTVGLGGAVAQTRVLGTADGEAVAITTSGTSTATARVGVDDHANLDGSVTRTFTFADGRTEAFTVNAAGEVLHHESHPPPTPAPAGATTAHRGVVLEIDAGGTTPHTVEQHLADGTVRQVTRSTDIDSIRTDSWTEPDGSTVVERSVPGGPGATTTTTALDGTTTVLVRDGWQAELTTTGPDGVTTVTTATSFSPSAEVLRTTVGDVETSVVLDADGDGATATIRDGGTTQTVRVAIEAVANPDGSVTHVLRFPDGRTELVTTGPDGAPVALETRADAGGPATPTGDPGAAVNGSYHGGTVREDVTTDPATGAEHITRTYADGTVVELDRPAPGEDAVATLPDGTRVAEQGGGGWGTTTSEAPDGTLTRRWWDDLAYTALTEHPDGASSETQWTYGAAGVQFRTTETGTDGTETVTGVRMLADGGALATVTGPDGTTTARLDVDEIENVDGTVTRVFTAPDGRTDAFTLDANGVVVHHEGHPGHGGSTGLATERVIGTDPGTGRVTVEVVHADGTVQEVQRFATGDDVYESWVEDDGTRVTQHAEGTAGASTEVGPDGSSTVRRWDADTGFAEDRTELDGSATRFRTDLYGRVPNPGGELFSTVQIGLTGQTLSTSVVTTADGGAAAVATRSDGVSVTTRLDVRTVAHPDGSTTRVYTFPDGRTESVTVDGRTGLVIDHEGVPAGGPVPPAADSEATPPTVEVSTTPDGDRYEVRTHADGSVERITTSTVGNWVSEVTDAHGQTLRTDVTAGSISKTVTLADGSSTEVTRWPGSLVVRVTDVDGTEATTSTSEDGRVESSVYNPVTEQTILRIHLPDGTETQSIRGEGGASHSVSVAPDGTRTEIITTPGGDRSEQTDRPDGTIHIEGQRDGRDFVGEARPDGYATQTEIDGSRTTTVTKWPDGTIEQRTDDGAGTVEKLTTRTDHTWTKSTQLPDGGTREQNLTADGRITVLEKGPGGWPSTWTDMHQDGWRFQARDDADGSHFERVTEPDGTFWTKSEDRSATSTDPSATIESWGDTDGSLRTRITQPNGSWSEVHQYTNGDRVITQWTDPGTRNFGRGQVAGGDAPVPLERFWRLETASGYTRTELTYQDGSRVEITDPAGTTAGTPAATVIGEQNLLFVKKFDPQGALTLDTVVLRPPDTQAAPPGIPTLPPRLGDQSLAAQGAFRAAFALEGSITERFETGLFSGEFTAEGRIGGSIAGQGSVEIGDTGIDAQGSVEVFLGAEGRLGGTLGTPLGEIGGEADAEAMIYAAAAATAHIGLDGVQASVSAEAMVAARVGASGGGDLGFVRGEYGAEVGVGLGAELEADAEISGDRIGFSFDASIGLGIELGIELDLSFSPSSFVEGIGDVITDPIGAAEDVGEFFGDTAEWFAGGVVDIGGAIGDGAEALGSGMEDLADVVDDLAGDIEDAVGGTAEDIAEAAADAGRAAASVVEDVAGVLGDAAGAVGDVVDDLVDFAGDAVDALGDVLDDLF